MINQILSQARDKMHKCLDIVKTDLSTIRSGRATPAIVESITVKAYGGSQILKVMEMATITTQDAKTILITPYDPSQVGEIEKGIQEAHIGLQPVVEGEAIRIAIPSLSEERRKEYIKLAHQKLEGGRIMIRQVRQDAMKDIKRVFDEKQITEDDKKHGEKQVQELTDEMIAEIDAIGSRKEAELMQI